MNIDEQEALSLDRKLNLIEALKYDEEVSNYLSENEIDYLIDLVEKDING